MKKIEKLKYITKNRYDLLSEETRLLIEIVENLDKDNVNLGKELFALSQRVTELYECVHTPNKKTVKAIEEVEKKIKKPKKKLFRK